MKARFGVALALAVLVSACTATRPPQPYLPQRSGVVPGETITVKGNENVYAIAQENGVSMRDIIVLNNLQQPFALKPGQTLILPYKHGDKDSGVSPSGIMPGFTPSTPGSSMGAAPVSTIEAQELPPPEPVAAPDAKMGATNLPPVESLNAPTSPKHMVATTLSPQPVSPAPVPSPAATQTLASTAAAASAAAPAPSPSAAPLTMVWPVQGPVLSAYGPKGQGVNNDGVNIGAPKGSPVVAAANGIVVYAGNEMKGFGNLVLIRHEGGWVTAYAYLDRVLVSKDAVVAQGDMIGTVGKTGTISTPQLHFETRLNGKAVDPSGVIK